jgi:hypothetical protein
MYTMKASVAVAKEADAKKGVSPAKDNSIYRAQNEPERQLGSLRDVIGNIRRVGGTPSVDSIATQLSGMHTTQRAPVLLALQQTHGNRYVQRVVAGIQAKLKVGQPGDIYEQEADRVADAVMRMPVPEVWRQLKEEEKKKKEEELIQTKSIAEQITPLVQRQVKEEEILQTQKFSKQTPEVTPDLESCIQTLRSGGQSLPESVRAFFEPRFGYDFSQVCMHTDAQAAESARVMNALAYTVGKDIVFGAGQYAPNTPVGQRLLAHELVHTIQQTNEDTELGERPTGIVGPITMGGLDAQFAHAPDAGVPETTPETEEAESEEAAVAGGVIQPVRIVRDKNLWWFDGENAANYDEEAKLTAFGGVPGATRGTFQWDVIRGSGTVDFENNSDIMTRMNANRIGIKSTDASTAMGDVRVRCRWSNGSATRTLYHSFTVRAPDAGVVVSGPTPNNWDGGFTTQYVIEVRDQFGRRLPSVVSNL